LATGERDIISSLPRLTVLLLRDDFIFKKNARQNNGEQFAGDVQQPAMKRKMRRQGCVMKCLRCRVIAQDVLCYLLIEKIGEKAVDTFQRP